jgi:hypothetical protein
VRRFLATDPTSAKATAPPYHWDALTHLCFSNYLKHDRSRTPGFVAAATALLDAGVSANTGFFEHADHPHPSWEPVLYGACGVAHHPELTRLLLERGAEPNDGETCYHSPETHDNAALQILVETGKLTEENLGMMLIRKLDWHDLEGARYLLEKGAPAAGPRDRGWAPLHHALSRANDTPFIALLLDRGADPLALDDGITAIQRAARDGRRDVLAELQRRGISVEMTGLDGLLGALAMGDDERVAARLADEPALRDAVIARGGELLCKWCASWNWDGMRRLLDLGVPVNTPFDEGHGYHGLAPGSLAIQAAAWFLLPRAMRLLIERGADVNAAMPRRNKTPLQLYVEACTASYWTEMRSLEGVQLLVAAGADSSSIALPTGWDELDALLREQRVTH